MVWQLHTGRASRHANPTVLVHVQAWQLHIGVDMMLSTYESFLTLEGFMEQEAPETDLRGKRGIFIAGSLFSMLAIRYDVHST